MGTGNHSHTHATSQQTSGRTSSPMVSRKGGAGDQLTHAPSTKAKCTVYSLKCFSL